MELNTLITGQNAKKKKRNIMVKIGIFLSKMDGEWTKKEEW